MKKICLFDTALATSNLGDEIILEGVRQGLKEILYESLVFRLATHIENWSAFQMIYKGIKMRQICIDVDYKFIAGTNLFVNNLKKIRPQFCLNIFNKVLYKNAIFVGVGKCGNFEKFKNKYTMRLYKNTLSKEYCHSVRDEATKKAVEMLGLKAINTGCPTLWGFTKEKCNRIPTMKAPDVIISVSGYEDQLDREADKLMLSIIKKNYKKIYAWIQTSVDYEYLKSLINIDEWNIECIFSLGKFNDVLNGDVDYIGTRLHGGIYALQHEKRSIIVSIDERAIGFHESNNIPIIKREEIDKLDQLINSRITTDIKVDRDAINTFLNQFLKNKM